MTNITTLLSNNKTWQQSKIKQDPSFFSKLAAGQQPEFLWIGCSDSRVPAEQVTGTGPGDLFVHRNIANQVHINDPNTMSVVKYAVDVLKVKHIIVCGHYGCGGVQASMDDNKMEFLETWLEPLKAHYQESIATLNACESETEKSNKMCELNVIRQVEILAQHELITRAWNNQQELAIHGWIHQLSTGLITDLEVSREKAV